MFGKFFEKRRNAIRVESLQFYTQSFRINDESLVYDKNGSFISIATTDFKHNVAHVYLSELERGSNVLEIYPGFEQLENLIITTLEEYSWEEQRQRNREINNNKSIAADIIRNRVY